MHACMCQHACMHGGAWEAARLLESACMHGRFMGGVWLMIMGLGTYLRCSGGRGSLGVDGVMLTLVHATNIISGAVREAAKLLASACIAMTWWIDAQGPQQ